VMQIVQAPRALAILYSLLAQRADSRPWLLPANICPIVPVTFFKARVPFELVDISTETLHMDVEQARGRLKRKRYGGILYAHTYGEPSTPHDFFGEVKSRYPDLLLVDDRCLCLPDLKPASSAEVDVMLYSTGYAKIVDLGLGGYAFVSEGLDYQPAHLPFAPHDHDQIEKAYKQTVQNHIWFVYHDSNWLETDRDIPVWYDYCQQIEIGLKASLGHRGALNDVYAKILPADIQLPGAYQTWRFNIRVKDKQRVLDAIFKAGLFASSHYASLAGIMAEGHAPQAHMLANHVINLFNDRHFTVKQAERVCAVIRENLK